MDAVPQCGESVGAVRGVEVRASRDGILARIGRSAVTLGEGVMLEVVVPGKRWSNGHSVMYV